jgi:predicted nucleic acid-binding protein
MILIDTNVFLELALDQERASDCASFLSEVAMGNVQAVVTHSTIHAVEASLRSGNRLTDFLRNIESSEGLRVSETGIAEEASIALLAGKMGKDFDDALQYFVARREGASAIVSFDRHFDGLDLPRLTPKEALKNEKTK